MNLNCRVPGDLLASSSLGNNSIAKVMDQETYLSAWNKYLKAMVYYHPQLTPELLVHQKQVCDYAGRYHIRVFSGLRFQISRYTMG